MERIVASFVFGWAIVVGVAPLLAEQEQDAPKGDEVIRLLREGNSRYVAGRRTHPHADASRREETATKGQRPMAAVLGCSDSRAPVEMVFDQGIGDLFVIRVAGNVFGDDEIASAEYAVQNLRVPLVVVLGHSQCGAVNAVVEGSPMEGHLERLASRIRPALNQVTAANVGLQGKTLAPLVIEANVRQAISDLIRTSPLVRRASEQGKLKVVGAVYQLGTGEVRWLAPVATGTKP